MHGFIDRQDCLSKKALCNISKSTALNLGLAVGIQGLNLASSVLAVQAPFAYHLNI